MAIVLDEPSAFEVCLNYALFAGAIFQLVCILAVIIIPQSETENSEKVEESVTSTAVSGSQQSLQPIKFSHDYPSRKGRKERKKHR